MDNSILRKISTYAKMNDISFDGFYYNFNAGFPEALYETVINYLRKSNPAYKNEKPIYDFYIAFDKNKNAYFEFLGKDKETKFIVLQNDVQYDIKPPKPLIIKESIFLENVKNLDHAKNHIILNNLPLDFIKRFIKNKEDVSSINDIFDVMTNEIIEYIKYLEYEFNFSYNILDNENKEDQEVEKIYFFESKPSENQSRKEVITVKQLKERKNDKIPFEERRSILDDFEAEQTFEAYSKNTSSKYYVKAFNIKGKYKIITEPKEANKYTKVIYIDKEVLSRQEVIDLTINSLELSRNDITATQNITRHSHTTLEEYKKLLEYIINEKNLGINYSTKERIDKASDTKKI